MKKKIAFLSFLGIILTFAAITAQARIDTPKANGNSVASQKNTTSGDSTFNSNQNKCEKVASKIQAKVGSFEDGQKRRLSAYENMSKRISNIIVKMEEKGLDTADLKADLVILEAKIANMSKNYSSYIGTLNGSRGLACDDNSKFKNKLGESRTLLTQVKKDALDIRSFYSTVIRPDIVALKNKLKLINQQRIKSTTTATTTATSTQ